MKFWTSEKKETSPVNFLAATMDSNAKALEYPVPRLLVIDEMVRIALEQKDLPNLSKTVFIGVQHMLETTVTLFDALIRLGIKPENMFFTGKYYSSSPLIENQVYKRNIKLMPTTSPGEPGHYQDHSRHAINKMWQACLEDIKNKEIDRLIILDEGGRCLEEMPKFLSFNYQIASIEQTRAGLYSDTLHRLFFPLIEVASSAVKKQLEPPLIAIAALRKLKEILPSLSLNKETVCGIIGNGAIGFAIAHYLLSQGYNVVVYDKNEQAFLGINSKKFFRADNIGDLIANSQCIFGCTGIDVTQGLNILDIAKDNKIFISCTSEDKEFLSLLKTISDKSVITVNPLSDITCKTNTGNIVTILRGGFPINFDQKPWNVPANDIEVTQGLLLGGCIQAIKCATKPIGDGLTINRPIRQKLNPYVQRFVVDHWIPYQPKNRHDPELIMNFQDIDWINKNSGGFEHTDEFLYRCYSQEQPLKPDLLPKPKL